MKGAAQRFLKNPTKLNIGGGVYNKGGIKSIGGRIGTNKNYVGGTLGIDRGKPFGSYNISGKVGGSFGPQGY